MSLFVCFTLSCVARLLTVAGVAEHDAEQKWKRDDGIKRRISLAIRRHAVRVDQILKTSRKFVRSIERRGIFVRVDHVEESRHGASDLPLKGTRFHVLVQFVLFFFF